jgi:iron complex outermembrane recepter protein
MRYQVQVLYACASIAALCAAAPALSQAAPVRADDPVASGQDGKLPDIVVTAEKRPSIAQRTPVAMTVATGAALRANGVTDFNQLANIAPTLNIATNNANTLITIRGVSSRDYTETGDPAVAVSVDNFYLQRAFALNAALFDIDQVSVLRGPQGTLYGRNATAGAVNIVSAKPDLNRFGINASSEIGNYGEINMQAAVNVPLSPTLGLRVAGARNTHDGYRDNAPMTRGDDQDTTGARVHLLWKPDSNFSALLTGEYTRIGGVGAVIKDIPYADVKADGTLDLGDTGRWPLNNQGYTHISTKAVRGTVAYNFGFATLSYFGGFQKSSLHRDNDQDGGLFANYGFQQNEDVYDQNHEIRIASAPESRFIWQAGGYYFHEIDHLNTYFQVHSDAAPPIDAYIFSYRVTSESKAAFAQVGYKLTDELKVEAGIRYTDDKKSQVGHNRIFGDSVDLDNHYSGHKITWHAGVNYQVTPRNLIYAKADRGYKAGGYTQINTFGPETITAYEVGSKNRFFDNRLELNLDARPPDRPDR